MYIEQWETQRNQVRLWGLKSSLEVESPLEGILRLRLAPSSAESSFVHPRLPTKKSWAVVASGPGQPLSTHLEGERVHVQTPLLSLRLELGRLRWTLFDANGRQLAHCERVEGSSSSGYPVHTHRSTFSLEAPPSEAYLGFGEKVGPLDKRGMQLRFWNTDVVPHHPDTDPLYVSIPFFIGLRDGQAWGLFLDEPWRSQVDVALTDPRRLTWESTGPELDLYLLAGPHPSDVVRRYTALTGRPQVPPLWSLGAQQSRWGYENADDIRGVIDGHRSRDLPLDCVYLDIDHQDGYRTLTWDTSRFPDPAGLAEEARTQGVRLVPIVDPALLAQRGYPLYDEALAQDFLVRTDRGEVLQGEVWPVPAVFPDFTREEVQSWWSRAHAAFLGVGMSGFWNDMNEPSCFSLAKAQAIHSENMPGRELHRAEGKTLPDTARHGKRRHLEVHNVYALAMGQATFEALRTYAPNRRPFVLSRAGYAGIQRYAAVWTGDNSSHWGHLELSIPMLLGLGLCGVAFSGVDIPGFVGRPTPELFVRWTQTGVFYPLMRNHSAKGGPWQEPWRYGEPTLGLARQALKRRYRLLPTLYTLMEDAARTGLPPLRPLCFHTPEDTESVGIFDQFLFGPDVLVAPVVRPGQPRRMVYLPRGRWLYWPNFDAPQDVMEGPRHLIIDAPLDTTPLWLREGSAVALTSPALHTSTASWGELTWHIHVGDRIVGRLYEDEGEGEGPHRVTHLGGERQGDLLVLLRRVEGTLPVTRSTERILLHGLQAPHAVQGAQAQHFDGQSLELTVAADWKRLEIHLSRARSAP